MITEIPICPKCNAPGAEDWADRLCKPCWNEKVYWIWWEAFYLADAPKCPQCNGPVEDAGWPNAVCQDCWEEACNRGWWEMIAKIVGGK